MKYRSGQTVIEVMVAIGILVVGFLGAVQLLADSLGVNRTIEENHIGTFLAAEGMEVVRNLIDYNFFSTSTAFNDGLPDGCYRVAYDTTLVDAGNPITFPQPIACDVTQAPPLLFDRGSKFYNYQTGAPTSFRRLVRITATPDPVTGEPYRVGVSSTVMWTTRRGIPFDVVLESYFYKQD